MCKWDKNINSDKEQTFEYTRITLIKRNNTLWKTKQKHFKQDKQQRRIDRRNEHYEK